MQSAAAFGSIFTGSGGAPMIFSRLRRHKKDIPAAAAFGGGKPFIRSL